MAMAALGRRAVGGDARTSSKETCGRRGPRRAVPVAMMTTPTWRRLVFEKGERIALAERLLDRLDIRPGQTFLEIGCGMGYASALAAERGARVVVATDLSHAYLVRHAVRTAAIMEADVLHVAANAHKLPFGVGAFDRVWSANMLYQCQVPTVVVAEIRRVLKPGGRWLGLERIVPAWMRRREQERMDVLNEANGTTERAWTLQDWQSFAWRTHVQLTVLPGRRVRSARLRRWMTVARPGRVVLEVAAHGI